jgi:hypothetical protein
MRILMFVIATSAALVACGQPATTGGEAAAQSGGVPANAQADFVTRCTDALVRQNPQARQWAPSQCDQEWQTIVAAGAMAEAILAAAPVSGAANAASLPNQLTMVRWDRRPEGALLASGRLGRDLSVQIDRAGPSLAFGWGETGAMIPYDVIGALRVRGAEPAMIGCSQIGVGEFNKAYRVAAPGRAPFMLSIYDRTAPTANAESFYTVSLNLAGQVQTLAQLRRDGGEWATTCAY